MEEQGVQKSCWGVTTWAVAVFLGIFAVISFLGQADTNAEKIVSIEVEQQ